MISKFAHRLRAQPRLKFTQTLRWTLPLGAVLILASCSNAPRQSAQIAAPAAPLSRVLEAAHVDPEKFLNRITWGANPSSSQQLQIMGMDRYLDQQLRGQSTPLPAAIQAQIDGMTIAQRPLDKLMIDMEARRLSAEQQKGVDDTLRKEYQQELTRLAREAASRSLLRAVYSPNQLQEQMTWFWMNHFNIHNGKHNVRAMLGDFEEQAIRPNALGNFRELLRATVFHPAMLRYLDNEHNAVNHINENYARELMELHTMGVGSGYTQGDVQELARVLTGVGVNQSLDSPRVKGELQRLYVRRGIFEFNPNRHDFGDKKILGKTVHGRGLAEVEDIITILSRQPATAQFISRELATYFVSDTPSDALINQMAQRFLQTDGNIPAVLRSMFESSEFIASLGNKFKDPVHYVISSVRLAYDGNTIVNAGPMLNWLTMLGQQPNGRQTPDGYSMSESAWASPGQMTVRFDVAKAIGNGSPGLFKIDNQALQERPPQPALASSAYVKNWARNFSQGTQQALSQASSAQEWNAFFLAAPEMMRR
ncbi:DUF1800 domain-containing protein [Undibacterium sp. Jales W-56]|uniref:DUF1800 domain-containing protein n=1 Tax=Undibacterium sp. Jales W-56 TaxID=2897325 RepID=UPI0021D0BC63|nr:DUF1800 domain-containing protein [Undibacterium sp. Jales W-56]MCU6434163.1 DUF1800 domain-containing protein [Undibacterium sp. Jales W-56]